MISTVDSDGIERSWRTWIGVRNVAGEWIVEGFFPLKPIPPPVA